MLSMNNINDKQKMMKYYRTSDMLNLLYFFPELSPIADLTIVEDEADYLEHRDYLDSLTENRVDTLILGAFGCGVFGQAPIEVANVFKGFLRNEFNGCFKKVIFAVPDKESYHYLVFEKTMRNDR